MKRKSSKHHHQYLTEIGPGGRHKYATRHLAALDFLQSISMKNEFLIKEAGCDTGMESQNTPSKVEVLTPAHVPEVVKNCQSDVFSLQRGGLGGEDVYNIAGGKKLNGVAAAVVSYPGQFRYRMIRFHEQSAVVKKWESQALLLSPAVTKDSLSSRRDSADEGSPRDTMLNSRCFFSRSRGYPSCLHSIIPYAPEAEKARLEKLLEYSLGTNVYKVPQRDWRGTSYGKFFQEEESTTTETEDVDKKSVMAERKFLHDPDILDDTELVQGKHRHVMRGDALTGPVMSSVILYVNAKDLKDDLNNKFREKHPNLPQSISLSKIRNLKTSALLGCLSLGIEMSTIAIAFILFEHLCLKGVVTKTNRRLSMAVCLVLAIKFNEPVCKDSEDAILEFADRQWSIPKKEIMDAEFGAFVQLNFSLHIPQEHIHLMYIRLLKQVHKTSRVYLGEERYNEYTKSLMELVRGSDNKPEQGTATKHHSNNPHRLNFGDDNDIEVDAE